MEANPFYQLAQAMWKRGDDGEIIARDLAKALLVLIKEGTSQDPAVEFVRLANMND